MKRITYSQRYRAEAQVAPPSQHSDELGERLRAAMAIGIAAFVLLTGLSAMYLMISGVPRVRDVMMAVGIVMIVSAGVTAVLTITWSSRTVIRPWRWEEEERDRAWDIEDEELARRYALEDEMRSSPSPPVGATGARLWVVAFMLLQRHAQGEDTTRDACVDARVCTQGEWNLINEAFRRLGWKKGYRLTAPPDLSQAWWEWEDRAYISDDDRLWIRTGKQDVEIK